MTNAELQSAIDNAHQNGGSVTIPSGVTDISVPLIHRSGVHLYGRVKSILKATTNHVKGMIQIEDGAYNVGYFNLTVDTNGSVLGIANLGTVNDLTLQDCEITSTAPTATYLVNLDGRLYNLKIKDNLFSEAQYPIRVKNEISTAVISGNTFFHWKQYAILIRGGPTYGPQDILISRNSFSDPLPSVGGARQMIVIVGDPITPITNIFRLKVLHNKCVGPSQPYDLTSPNSLGTGDQIVLHCCKDLEVIGNKSIGGGENGISVTRSDIDGLIESNYVEDCDGHGIQISRPTTPCKRILTQFNYLLNNGQRKSAKTDTLASIYSQHGEDNAIKNNTCIDETGKQKYGILVAASKRETVRNNTIVSQRPGFEKIGNAGGSTILP